MADAFEKMIRGEDERKSSLPERELIAAKHVLSTRDGRRFFYALMGVCHFGRSAFAGENTNTSQALTGKQLVGEWALGLLNLTSPEAYGLMVKEAKEDEDNDRRTREQHATNSDAKFTSYDDAAAQPR